MKKFVPLVVLVCSFCAFAAALFAQPKRTMTFDDAMRFRVIEGVTLSSDGKWLGYIERPDRGDPVAKVQSTNSLTTKAFVVERGSRIIFSADGRWAAVTVAPRYLVAEKAPPANRPDNGLNLIETATGKQTTFENVSRFTFSENSAWISIHFTKNRKEPRPQTKDSAAPRRPAAPAAAARDRKPEPGTTLALHRLSDAKEWLVPFVKEYSFDSVSTKLSYATLDTANNGALWNRALQDTVSTLLDSMKFGAYTGLSWTKSGTKLAYLSARAATNGTVTAAALKLWNTVAVKTLVQAAETPKTYILPSRNSLVWAKDNQRLVFGFKPIEYHDTIGTPEPTPADTLDVNLYNPASINKAVEGDVWHWNDPYINIHQKKLWEQLKDRTMAAIVDTETGRVIPVADRDIPSVDFNESHTIALGRSDAPYRKEITWSGSYNDGYIISTQTGEKTKFADKIDYALSLSPSGNFATYYNKKHWYLYDVRSKSTRNLTEKLNVGFWDDEDDHPADPPPYGLAGWVMNQGNDAALLLYSKEDIWRFTPATGEVENLTGAARKPGYQLRIQRLDTTKRFYTVGEQTLIVATNDRAKNNALYGMTIATETRSAGLKLLLEDKKRYSRFVKAQNANQLVFSQSTYTQYPDVWLSDLSLKAPKQVTDLQKQVDPFAWGSAELVEWLSTDGKPLQGVLIKPGNYQPGKRYPVIVYFYEIMSDRLYDFAIPAVGSRPAFGLYASQGYALFLPDVRYINGLPGQSAMRCIMPGIQKIIDMGVADPKAIGLHGHSWGGYQTMYMITQTDLFKAAIAGAAVANMTSAYGGIRYGTGLARMFQYEKSQSRLGATLWERRDLYIENSPLFFTDRITTPTLMMFGDDDDAVPWTQGIEMYLAMRRLGKDAIFLQYRKEPHHPRKYANRYDYAVKMKEYFDHYLLGTPAPEWIRSGVPYQGK